MKDNFNMDMLKLCNRCRDEDEETFHGYIGWVDENCYECPICQNKMTDTIITIYEYNVIDAVSNDIIFLEAMIRLKQDDVIEFQLKMNQFKTQLQQREQIKEQQKSNNQPYCPHCKSTNIKPISTLNRGASIAMWGIFSKKINKSFECKNCGYTW